MIAHRRLFIILGSILIITFITVGAALIVLNARSVAMPAAQAALQ